MILGIASHVSLGRDLNFFFVVFRGFSPRLLSYCPPFGFSHPSL